MKLYEARKDCWCQKKKVTLDTEIRHFFRFTESRLICHSKRHGRADCLSTCCYCALYLALHLWVLILTLTNIFKRKRQSVPPMIGLETGKRQEQSCLLFRLKNF